MFYIFVVESPSRKSDLTFGGYSPSIGSDDRPLTAPTSRGVRFADELGLDLDDSLTRPTSAPQQKQNKSNLKNRDSVSLELSLDESDRKTFAKESRRSSSSLKKGNPNNYFCITFDWLVFMPWSFVLGPLSSMPLFLNPQIKSGLSTWINTATYQLNFPITLVFCLTH